jgi:hypothetical protein
MPFVLSRWKTPPGYDKDVAILLRPLSVAEWQELQRLSTDKKADAMACTNYMLERGITDWRGFKELDSGDDMPFTPEDFTRIPHDIQDWALNELQSLSIPSQDEEKNSELQSTLGTKKPKARARSTAGSASTGGTATTRTRRRSRSSK